MNIKTLATKFEWMKMLFIQIVRKSGIKFEWFFMKWFCFWLSRQHNPQLSISFNTLIRSRLFQCHRIVNFMYCEHRRTEYSATEINREKSGSYKYQSWIVHNTGIWTNVTKYWIDMIFTRSGCVQRSNFIYGRLDLILFSFFPVSQVLKTVEYKTS